MKKKGAALVVVIFFAFAIAIIFFAMAQSNTNLAFQNKNAIKSLQAYYLCQSALQKAKLYLKVMPVDAFFLFKKSNNRYTEIKDNYKFFKCDLNYEKDKKYDLFNGGCDINKAPYGGNFYIELIENTVKEETNKKQGDRMVLDSYLIKAVSYIDDPKDKNSKNNKDEIEEVVNISRYSGVM